MPDMRLDGKGNGGEIFLFSLCRYLYSKEAEWQEGEKEKEKDKDERIKRWGMVR